SRSIWDSFQGDNVATRSLSISRLLHAQQIIPGAILIAFWWPVSWLGLRPLSDFYFFPLWLGYVLFVDGIVELRTGTSLFARDKRRFVLLFASSVPFWWIFEWMNRYLHNWHYHSPANYPSLAYFALASIAFSTVIPAVLEMSEL